MNSNLKNSNPIETRAADLLKQGVEYSIAWSRALNEYHLGLLDGRKQEVNPIEKRAAELQANGVEYVAAWDRAVNEHKEGRLS